MATPLPTPLLEQALRQLGESLELPQDVSILLVGGAAGMMTGLLSVDRVTTDCDVMLYLPPEAMAAVEYAATSVANTLKLPDNWLNSDVQLRRDALPEGWDQRKVWVCTHGQLTVWAASRPDLIAMKVLAGRDQDLEDLSDMRVRPDDVAFVQSYLRGLAAKGTPPDQIADAQALLASLEIHDDK